MESENTEISALKSKNKSLTSKLVTSEKRNVLYRLRLKKYRQFIEECELTSLFGEWLASKEFLNDVKTYDGSNAI